MGGWEYDGVMLVRERGLREVWCEWAGRRLGGREGRREGRIEWAGRRFGRERRRGGEGDVRSEE